MQVIKISVALANRTLPIVRVSRDGLDPQYIVNDVIMTPQGWSEVMEHGIDMSNLVSDPKMAALQWDYMMDVLDIHIQVRGKCWFIINQWSHPWGIDTVLSVMHDDGEICNKNDEHYLNGILMSPQMRDKYRLATGMTDMFDIIESALAGNEDNVFVLRENGALSE